MVFSKLVVANWQAGSHELPIERYWNGLADSSFGFYEPSKGVGLTSQEVLSEIVATTES